MVQLIIFIDNKLGIIPLLRDESKLTSLLGVIMTRKELIKALAEKQGITQITAEQFLDAVKSIIVAELTAGKEVNFGSDLGTFKPVTRTGAIPGTNTRYSTKSVKFSISAPFKTSLNS